MCGGVRKLDTLILRKLDTLILRTLDTLILQYFDTSVGNTTDGTTNTTRSVRWTRSAHLGGVSPRRKGNHEDPLPSGKKGNHTDVLPPGIPQPGRKGGRLMETPPASPSGLTGGPDATKKRPTVRATTGTRFPPFPSASCVVVCENWIL